MVAEVQVQDLLHPRLTGECLQLFEGGHHKHAALEAMQSVETALRETGVSPAKLFGARMIQKAFGRSGHIFLSLDPSDKLQAAAATFFEGSFLFYRNYAAHDGRKIDKQLALRIMVIASELLDLLGASRRSFTGIGGVEGLIEHGFFDSPSELATCLRFLDGNNFPDIAMDGFLESQADVGVSGSQIEVVLELGLVTVHEETGIDVAEELDIIYTTFALSDLGRKVLEEAESEPGTISG